jgi:hypothetical protein
MGDANAHARVELLHGAFLFSLPARGASTPVDGGFHGVRFACGSGAGAVSAVSATTALRRGLMPSLSLLACRREPAPARRTGQLLLLHPDGTVAGAMECPVPDPGHRYAPTEHIRSRIHVPHPAVGPRQGAHGGQGYRPVRTAEGAEHW